MSHSPLDDKLASAQKKLLGFGFLAAILSGLSVLWDQEAKLPIGIAIQYRYEIRYDCSSASWSHSTERPER
ncbi:MAG: hypothetical protein RL885_13905, partial [Planctomycetota bacterium]